MIKVKNPMRVNDEMISEKLKMVDLMIEQLSSKLNDASFMEKSNKIYEKIEKLKKEGFEYLPILAVSKYLMLTNLEDVLIAFCISPEINARYSSFFKNLQGEKKAFPTLDLVFRTMGISESERLKNFRIIMDSRLFQLHLLEFDPDKQFIHEPNLLKPIKPSKEFLKYLHCMRPDFLENKIKELDS